MNTLITLGTFSAYLFSAAITIAPRLFESLGLGALVYFDTAVMILAFILLGRLLESRARRRTGDAVKALLMRRPRTARRVSGAGVESVPVEAHLRGPGLRRT